VEFNNMFMTLMRSEQARSVLLGELLTPSMVAAIVDIDGADGYKGHNPEVDAAWAQLATIATSESKKRVGVQ
jgi:hypothetical protein